MGEPLPQALGDVAEIVMGQSPAGETCNRAGVGVPLLNGPTEFGPHHPQASQFTVDPRKHSQPGDILFCVRGSTTGRMNWSDRSYAIGRGIAAIRHKDDTKIQPLLRSIIEYNLPTLLQSATGSTFPNVSAKQLAGIPFPSVDQEQQRRIASLFGALDDKIELNRKTNETLEAMARGLFKDWFVDFGPTRTKMEGREPYLAPDLWALFPDRLDEATGLPEGWEQRPLDGFFSIIGGGTPKTSNPEFWNGEIPWFSVTDTPTAGSVFVVDTEKSITEHGLNGSSARLIEKGKTIISARGTVGNLAVAARKMTFNQSCYGLEAEGAVGDYTVYLIAQNMVTQLQARAHGSVFSTITRQTFSSLSMVKATDDVLHSFEQSIAPLFEKILANVLQSRTLAQTRDLLLPKLMSGEIRLREAEQIAGEAL